MKAEEEAGVESGSKVVSGRGGWKKRATKKAKRHTGRRTRRRTRATADGKGARGHC